MKAENRIPLAILLIMISGLVVFSVVMDGSSIGYNRGQALASRGFLKSEGTRVVDKSGNDFLLRGANFFGYEFGLWDTHKESDYQKMNSWGFNVVRLPIAWNFIEPQPGSYDDSYLANYVDRDIAWARKYGIYIILDMHQYCWSPYFTFCDSWHTAGVPSWSVTGYPNTSQGQAHGIADFWSKLGPNGSAPSATNPSMQDRYAAMWKHVASRYTGQNVIAAFDLLNEPTPCSSNGKYCLYNVDTFRSLALATFYEKVVDAIRSVDNNHMLLWEPDIHTTHLRQSTLTKSPNRPNMIYSPHYPGGSSGYDGNKTDLSNAVGATVRFANDSGQPVFIGEWGISDDETNAAQYIRDLGDIMHNNALGWAWWTYGRTSFEMGLIDEHGAERGILVTNLLWVLNQQ